MLTKKFREIYPVDYVSNESTWEKVLARVEEILAETDDDLLIDFKGIHPSNPWVMPSFQQLVKNKRVHMKFVNDKEVYDHTRALMLMEGEDDSRISNEVTVVEKPKTNAEKRIEDSARDIIEKTVKIENGVATIELKNKYGQVKNPETALFISLAIEILNSEQGIEHFIIDFAHLLSADSVIDAVVQRAFEFRSKGIKVDINSTNEKVIHMLSMWMNKHGVDEYNGEKRVQFFASIVKKYPNLAGLFIKYKSGSTDEFGRTGKGKIVMSRIAIIRGFTKKDGKYALVIDTYNDEYFYTNIHWAVTHDNERLGQGPVCNRIEVFPEEIGFGNQFLGPKYHFIQPIQQDDSESRNVITGLNERGNNISVVMTIPERMKAVFDSWGIEYNEEQLDAAIERTNEFLAEKRAEAVQNGTGAIAEDGSVIDVEIVES